MLNLDKGLENLKAYLKDLPSGPGVYEMINQKGVVLYVGKAKNIARRVQSYTRISTLPTRLKRMVSHIHCVQVTVTRTELEALLLEMNFIKKKQPAYNILLKDGKSMAYLVLSAHSYPQLLKKRNPHKKEGKIFGPFLSINALDSTLESLYKTFRLRSCSDTVFSQRTRPCLQYHIKRCSAPCVGKISTADYHTSVTQAVDLLKGRSQDLQKQWLQEMENASHEQNYEKAAVLRDRLRSLGQVQTQQTIHCLPLENADIIAFVHRHHVSCIQVFCFRQGANYGSQSFLFPQTEATEDQETLTSFLEQFYRQNPPPEHLVLNIPLHDFDLLHQAFKELHQVSVQFSFPQKGDKKRILEHAEMNAQQTLDQYFRHQGQQEVLREKLQEVFSLPKPPQRIEVYDNSHWQGEHSYGGMIVCGPEGFARKEYRAFSFASTTGDDYDMMARMIQKRFTSCDIIPDLILIDGGKGQLSVVEKTLHTLGITVPVVAIAKGPVHRDGQETFYMSSAHFQLPEADPILHFLQHLRNEAHRFVIHKHRHQKRKQTIKSRLEDIPGIGPKRRQALLCHFGSVEAIQTASVADLQGAPNISAPTAKTIYAFFHSDA